MIKTLLLSVAALALLQPGLQAQTAASVNLAGTVHDGIGRVIAGATARLVAPSGAITASAATDAQGEFRLRAAKGSYRLEVSKASFAIYSAPVTLDSRNGGTTLVITLDLAPLQQSLVVTATGVPTPQSQLGQSVAVLDQAQVAARDGLTLDESLRELPGVQLSQSGAVGGVTTMSLRGTSGVFNQILLDGVPVQRFDSGAYDFSTLLPAAVDQVTLVQGADSVLYGSNAAAGVVAVSSRSGTGAATPELDLGTSYGTFDTVTTDAGAYGNWKPVDYGFSFATLDTRNEVPRDPAWNQSWMGNVGLHLPERTQARLVVHHISSRAGDPNAFDLFGVSDDSWQREGETYASLALQQSTTPRWTNQLTLSQSDLNFAFETISPTGTPFDPFGFGANYLGNSETIRGANGYSVTGQAILDFAGTYPQSSASDTLGRSLGLQSEYALTPDWTVIAGYRAEDQRGLSQPRDGWHSQGLFGEVRGGIGSRVFASAGLSEDYNARFGDSFNPQASVALLPRLQRGGWWDELRLRANAGTAQMDPTLLESQFSLFQYALGSPIANEVSPLAPQRAHTFEVGLDQYLIRDVARFSATWFDDRYDDLIEFVPTTAFGQLGIGAAATAAAQSNGGAYLNSLSQSSKGMELELASQAASGWHARLAFTYLDAAVLRSFSSDAVAPSFNPQFPAVPIGAFAPLVGARPFRVAPDSGVAEAGYRRHRWQFEGDATFSSRRDDSTFLSDGFFGPTLLLPNHDLDPAYAALNFNTHYQLTSHVTLGGAVDNLLNQNYEQVFGYPSLGRALRLDLRLTLSHSR